jgi:hypothetical protein
MTVREQAPDTGFSLDQTPASGAVIFFAISTLVPVRKQSLDTGISLDQTAASGGISSSDVLKNTPNQGDTQLFNMP